MLVSFLLGYSYLLFGYLKINPSEKTEFCSGARKMWGYGVEVLGKGRYTVVVSGLDALKRNGPLVRPPAHYGAGLGVRFLFGGKGDNLL